MRLRLIYMAIYATFLTNYYGLKLKLTSPQNTKKKKLIRTTYSKKMLGALNLKVNPINLDKVPKEGQFLLVSNHRSIIDPTIIEIATENTHLFGHWIAKKELYNSFFFGLFVRNAGTVLLDREASKMSGFFTELKSIVKQGDSLYIFPEGTRNKSEKVLGDFKEGSRLIALKNRLPILPVYIRTDAGDALKTGSRTHEQQTIDVEFGDIIDYKDKTPLQESYMKVFGIEE